MLEYSLKGMSSKYTGYARSKGRKAKEEEKLESKRFEIEEEVRDEYACSKNNSCTDAEEQAIQKEVEARLKAD